MMNPTPYRWQQLMVLLESEVFLTQWRNVVRDTDECLARAVYATGSPLMLKPMCI